MRAGSARIAVWCALIALIWSAALGTRAEVEQSTIYLTNGGKLRGEIVIDVPGSPLTVMVAGQAMQVPREQIRSIESGSTAPAAGMTSTVVAPMPAAQPAPVPIAAPASPPPVAASGQVALQLDRGGRATIDGSWSPELQQLVLRRNDLSHSIKRKGLAAPITMLSLGAFATIITAVGATVAANNYESCVIDHDYSTYDTCSSAAPTVMAVGYTLGAALLSGGTTFLIVRLLKRKSLRRQLALVDQDLQRFNVMPIARVNTHGGASSGLAGLALSARF